MKLVHWPLIGGLLHWYSEEAQTAKAPPRCIKCNSPPINGQCTNHRIAALLFDFNVPVKGLSCLQNSKCFAFYFVSVKPRMATTCTVLYLVFFKIFLGWRNTPFHPSPLAPFAVASVSKKQYLLSFPFCIDRHDDVVTVSCRLYSAPINVLI